jgi:hypothetical protein
MENVLETMQDYRDIEDVLRDGFRSISSIDVPDEELESELNELIREDETEKMRSEEATFGIPRPATVAVPNGNRIRVGKRVLDLSDLPEVPSGFTGPSTSSANKNGRDDSLEERWKRLRMHAT